MIAPPCLFECVPMPQRVVDVVPLLGQRGDHLDVLRVPVPIRRRRRRRRLRRASPRLSFRPSCRKIRIGLCSAAANQVGIDVPAPDVGEAADRAEHLAELVGPVPRHREGRDGAELAPPIAWSSGLGEMLYRLFSTGSSSSTITSSVLVVERVVLLRTVGGPVAPVGGARFGLLGRAAGIDEDGDRDRHLAAVDQVVEDVRHAVVARRAAAMPGRPGKSSARRASRGRTAPGRTRSSRGACRDTPGWGASPRRSRCLAARRAAARSRDRAGRARRSLRAAGRPARVRAAAVTHCIQIETNGRRWRDSRRCMGPDNPLECATIGSVLTVILPPPS